MKKGFLLFCLSAFFCLAGAEPRIGVVDLDRIFREYYKSKIAEELIRQQGEVYRQYLLKLDKELRALRTAAATAQIEAQNVALSPAARKAAVDKAAAAERAAAEKKAELELYARGRSADMKQLETTRRNEILKDIHAQIARSAALFGYAFVFDRSGRTTNGQSALMLFPPEREFTLHVITELNRSRSKAQEKSGVKKP